MLDASELGGSFMSAIASDLIHSDQRDRSYHSCRR